VLATVDGQPVTAADFGLQLVTSLLQWGDKTTADACADALRLYKAAVSAPLFLAASLRLSLTDAEGAAARSNAEAEAGCLGCKAEYYETRQTVLALCGKLESYYAARDGHDGKTADASYHAALDDAAAALILKPAPALAALDLSAVRARALSAPLGTWLGLS
jgi:hypothetical protein